MKHRAALAIPQSIVGLGLLGWGFYNAHVEVHREPRSVSLTVLFIAIGLLGALVLPSIGARLLLAAKGGVGVADPYLPHFGRREAAGEIMVKPPVVIDGEGDEVGGQP